MAIIGMFFQDGLTGSAWGDWSLYTDSPLRAAEEEEKAPPPFDPAQQVKFPGFDSVPAGVGAVTTPPGTYGFLALFLASGAMELGVWTEDPSKEAGDFGDPLGLGQYNEEFRNKELNNGRFAMFAALGIISADLFTGKDAMQQFGL
ncbi:FCPF [Symbiodinium pilosum]|uniref:FCPF protein n=1 Tax=Symbiodinium pilosum TaxID=2952 RepID=A0A812S0H9_SYMPI|nr:FCPF [Symbiodinium pilosum]